MEEMKMAEQMKKERARRLFLIAFVLFTFANGFGGSIISNYFKGVYQVDSVQRGLLEIPRELPGVVGVFVITALSGCGNLTLAMLSFCLYAVGMFVLGLLSPGYLLMQLFVFTYSLGDHIVMPVRDAIAMDLADEGKTGTFLGKYRGYATMGSMAASLLVFIGFRYGAFWFWADRKIVPSFCVSLVVVAAALFFLWRLRREVPALDVRKHDEKKKGLPLKKKYIPYYIVTGVYGFQKRMRLVFAPWIIIELLAMGADTVALLGIVAHFGSSMFAPQIGKFLDRYGVKKGLVLESVTIGAIFLYAAWAVHGITSGVFTGRVEQIFAFTAYIFIMIADHFNAVHVMLMKKLSDSPADVMENLSFGLSVDHVLAVTVSGLLGAVWKFVGPEWVFVLGAAVCLVHFGVAVWLGKRAN